MGECCTSPVEELAVDHKRSRMLGPAEESATSTDSAEKVVLAVPHARSTNCVRPPTSATFPSCEWMSGLQHPTNPSREDGNAAPRWSFSPQPSASWPWPYVPAPNPRVLAWLRLSPGPRSRRYDPCNVYGLDSNFLRSNAEGAGGVYHLEFQMTRVTLSIA